MFHCSHLQPLDPHALFFSDKAAARLSWFLPISSNPDLNPPLIYDPPSHWHLDLSHELVTSSCLPTDPNPTFSVDQQELKFTMSPSPHLSAHLCKQIYSSWRQTRQTSPELRPSSLPSPPTTNVTPAHYQRSSSPQNIKRSMDTDRSDASSAAGSPPNSSWKWGSR